MSSVFITLLKLFHFNWQMNEKLELKPWAIPITRICQLRACVLVMGKASKKTGVDSDSTLINLDPTPEGRSALPWRSGVVMSRPESSGVLMSRPESSGVVRSCPESFEVEVVRSPYESSGVVWSRSELESFGDGLRNKGQYTKCLWTTPTSNDSERLRTTLNDFERLLTTPNDS